MMDPDLLDPERLDSVRRTLSTDVERRAFLEKAGRVAGGFALARCLTLLPPGLKEKPSPKLKAAGFSPATFEITSLFPEQMVAPSTGRNSTFLSVEVRNIGDGGSRTDLSVESESDYFKARMRPASVSPTGRDAAAGGRIDVTCSPGTPEGTEGWLKVVGRRGSETHRLWLKVTALTSRPKMELPRGMNFADLDGQGYGDPVLQPYTGKPVTWKMLVTNEGAEADTYRISHKAAFPCSVLFRDRRGKRIKSVRLPGRTRNLLFAEPAQVEVEVKPRGELPRNRPVELSVILGPGQNTRETSEVKVQLLNPGMLYCVNDLAGARPNAHLVMAGSITTYMFHVSNIDRAAADIRLSVSGGAGPWKVDLDSSSVKRLKPGETVPVVLSVVPPATAAAGERLELAVGAVSSTGRSEEVRVAAEVTDKPKVYYFSIDSMDPGYIDLDRKGTGRGKEGDWLMPGLRAFMKESVTYRDARVYLPSATDMNHTNALAGVYSGTSGVYMVGGTYNGFGAHDEVIAGNNDVALMLYGPEGRQVERAFEVAKRHTGGKAVCGFWSNKNWLTELEASSGLDLYGHSEHWPLFFHPPAKYRAAGDPVTDENPCDRLSASFRCCFHSNNWKSIILPTLLGQFDLISGARLLATPISLAFGKMPGMHAEDRYIYESFERSVIEEDPDVAYINLADLDNTGHFTGASSEYTFDEWEKDGNRRVDDDRNRYSPWVRREEALDICREADHLFTDFVSLLKRRGVYDSSIIVFLSDHGMSNMKDPKKGYDFIDLRGILRDNGFLRKEDYQESGGTELNFIWCEDGEKLARIERVLREYTVRDKELGEVNPLVVVNRGQMKNGMDLGEEGRIRPGELYSEYWVGHPGQEGGQAWPDLFIFPRYNYQVAAHGDVFGAGINAVGVNFGMKVPETVVIGMPGAHGGLGTTAIPLVFKSPAGHSGYRPGSEHTAEVEIGDIAPTIYGIMGWPAPDCVDGKPLPSP